MGLETRPVRQIDERTYLDVATVRRGDHNIRCRCLGDFGTIFPPVYVPTSRHRDARTATSVGKQRNEGRRQDDAPSWRLILATESSRTPGVQPSRGHPKQNSLAGSAGSAGRMMSPATGRRKLFCAGKRRLACSKRGGRKAGEDSRKVACPMVCGGAATAAVHWRGRETPFRRRRSFPVDVEHV